MCAVRSSIAGSPAGQNNMAALMWNNVVDREEADWYVIRMLLEAAKKSGVAVAAENLDVMKGAACTR
ncbi:MAG: hypothetical protein ACI4RD_06325 [Kiritimatiellia bacterium]